MSAHPIDLVSRRRLLQFLAASALFAHGALAETLRPSDPLELSANPRRARACDPAL